MSQPSGPMSTPSSQLGDPDHLKLFCQSGGGRRVFFAGNDPEEFAFE